MKNFFSNRTLLFALRIIIGSLFVMASIDKIINPNNFRIIILEYGLLPYKLIPIFVVVLPWVEFIAGLMLILNLYSKSNALIVMFLLVVFVIAIGINVLRGVTSDCGCFDLLGLNEEIGIMVIIRDIIMFLFVIPVFMFNDNK